MSASGCQTAEGSSCTCASGSSRYLSRWYSARPAAVVHWLREAGARGGKSYISDRAHDGREVTKGHRGH